MRLWRLSDCLPEVVRGVAVSDQENRDCGVVFGGVDAVGAAGVVFLGVGAQRLEQGFTVHVSKTAVPHMCTCEQSSRFRLTSGRRSGTPGERIALRRQSRPRSVSFLNVLSPKSILSHLGSMVDLKRSLALSIVVTVALELVVLADNNLVAGISIRTTPNIPRRYPPPDLNPGALL